MKKDESLIEIKDLKEVAERYQKVVSQVHRLTRNHIKSQKQIQTELGISKMQYFRRLKGEQRWTPEELLKLYAILAEK